MLEFVIRMVMSWGFMLLFSLMDALLISVFGGFGNIEFIMALGYWQLYWLNMAVLMPLGTAVGLGLAFHEAFGK